MAKRYPFNAWKHAHDIDFRINRARNEYDDKLFDKQKYPNGITLEEMGRYEDLIEQLDNLRDAIISTQDSRGIAWLTGNEYGIAQESVAWAESMRGVRV